MINNLPAMWETRVRSLIWKDPLEEGMATHSSTLAWRVPMDRGAWWATVQGVAKSDTTKRLSTHMVKYWDFLFIFLVIVTHEYQAQIYHM